MRIGAVCLIRESPPRSTPGIYLPNCVIILCGWQDPKGLYLPFISCLLVWMSDLYFWWCFYLQKRKLSYRLPVVSRAAWGKRWWKGILKQRARLCEPRSTWGLASLAVYFKYLGYSTAQNAFCSKHHFPFIFQNCIFLGNLICVFWNHLPLIHQNIAR